MKKEFKKGFNDILKGMQMSNNDINEIRGASAPPENIYAFPEGDCTQCSVCYVCYTCYSCSSCYTNAR
jgi:hypothetical protein